MQSQTQHDSRNALVGALMVLAAAVTVSSKAIIVKMAYAYPLDASTLIALRMAFSAPFFIAMALRVSMSASAPKITGRDAWMIGMLGFIGGYGPMLLDFAGLSYVTAGVERIILYIYPTVVVVMSALLFKHNIGKRVWFALAATYAGVAMAVGHDVLIPHADSVKTIFGVTLVAASAFLYAAYLVASGRLIPRVGSISFTAYTMLAVTVTSGAHYITTEHHVAILNLPTEVYLLSFLMAAIATVLPSILLNAGIHRIGSSRSSLISSAGPVSTILSAYVFLSEGITLLQLAGTAMVLAGVLVISVVEK